MRHPVLSLHQHAIWMVVGLLVAAEAAASPRPMREARSANGEVQLRIVPSRPHRVEGGECRGILRQRERGAGTRELWSRPLVNEISPMYAFVRDDARFVVTLDDFRHGGAKHAVVIYDAAGAPVREFGLPELLPGEDMRHVEHDGEALEWLDGAEFEFDEHLPQFVITLAWEREIRIDLEKLVVVGRDSGESAQPTTQPASTPQTASEQQAAQAEIAVVMAELEQLIAASKALESGETDIEAAGDGTAVLDEAAREQIRQAIEETARVAMLEATAEADPVDFEWDVAQLQELRKLAAFAESMQADQSGTSGVAVPAPQPGDPVDYVAWLNTFTQTEGESAAPLYEAASEATVANEFPDGLLERALDGDPDALADPFVVDWLDANADALADFREATGYEFNGYEMYSNDGTMIGILLPTLGNLRELTRVSVVEARIAEAEGDYDAAADSYLTAMAAGGHAARGVTIIEDLVGASMERMAGEGLLDMYARDLDNTIDYVAMVDRIDQALPERRPMAETVQFERAMTLDITQRIYDVNPETGNYRVSESGLEEYTRLVDMSGESLLGQAGTGFMLAQIGFERIADDTNEYFDDMTRAMQADYPTARQALGDLEAGVGQAGFHSNPIVSALAPALSRAYQLDVKAETDRRAIDMVTRLRAYRQEFGEYPATLEGLAGSDVIIDPYTGSPLAYYRNGDDFVLYSLGHNGTDEGGIHDNSGRENDLKYWPRPE